MKKIGRTLILTAVLFCVIARHSGAEERNPSRDVISHNNTGVHKINSRDYKSAIAEFSEAIRLDPNYWLAYANRAIARSMVDDNRGAIADYSELIRLKTDRPNAYLSRGILEHILNNQDSAATDFRHAIRLCSEMSGGDDYAELLFAKAVLHTQVADYKGAMPYFDKAVLNALHDIPVQSQNALHFKELALYHHDRGMAKRALGDESGAQKDFAAEKSVLAEAKEKL